MHVTHKILIFFIEHFILIIISHFDITNVASKKSFDCLKNYYLAALKLKLHIILMDTYLSIKYDTLKQFTLTITQLHMLSKMHNTFTYVLCRSCLQRTIYDSQIWPP